MRKLASFLFLILTATAFGQVTLIAATEDKDFRVNEKIILTFILSIEGNDRIQESPLRLPDFSKFNIIGSGSEQNSIIDPTRKIVINQTVMQFVLSPKIVGNIRIGSALVDVNGRTYKTEPMDIYVREAVEKKPLAKNNQVYLNMELPTREVYENQPTIAIIRAYSRDFNNLRNVSEVTLPGQKNVSISPLSFARSDIEQNEDSKMASQVIAVFSIMPERAGTVELKPASAVFRSGSHSTEAIASNKINFKVRSLPAGSPKDFKNTVGRYTISLENADAENAVQVDKPFSVVMKISGEGNLDESKIPQLINSENYTFYKPEISANLHRGRNGKRGQITAKYLVVPKTSGDLRIALENFSFFNPKTKKYTDLGEKSFVVNVMTPQQIDASKSTMERLNEYTNNVLETVDSPVMATKKLKVAPKAGIQWSTIFTNYSVIGGFFILLAGIGWAVRKYFLSAPQAAPVGSVYETEKQIREGEKFDFASQISYLNHLAEKSNFDEFFSNYEILENEAQNFVEEKHGEPLKSFFENKKGTATAEQYRDLRQAMEIEKYSPHRDSAELHKLAEKISEVFSMID